MLSGNVIGAGFKRAQIKIISPHYHVLRISSEKCVENLTSLKRASNDWNPFPKKQNQKMRYKRPETFGRLQEMVGNSLS